MSNELKEKVEQGTVESIKQRMIAIDARVATLEKCNDRHMARFGESNYAIYNSIQELMDERDQLYLELRKLESEEK